MTEPTLAVADTVPLKCAEWIGDEFTVADAAGWTAATAARAVTATAAVRSFLMCLLPRLTEGGLFGRRSAKE
jgi:hypothetical protein